MPGQKEVSTGLRRPFVQRIGSWLAVLTLILPCPALACPFLCRNARLNAKIDSKAGTVVMQVGQLYTACRA